MSRPKKVRIAPETVASETEEVVELSYRRASEIVASAPQWLWTDHIPDRCPVIIQGAKCAGKSTWLRHLAAVVSGGGKLPGDKKARKAIGGVLWHAAEEELESRVRPGLEAMGADLDRCHLADLASGDPEQMLALPADADRLTRRIAEWGIRLVVIDPLFSFLDGTLDVESSTLDSRRYMLDLFRVCQAQGVVIALSRNLTKDTSRGALAAGRGGGELGNAARSVLHLQELPGQPGTYGLAVAACNAGAPCETVCYRLAAKGKSQCIEIVGTSSITADELCGGVEADLDRCLADTAADLIRAMLPKGTLDSKVIKAKAEAAMIPVRTLQFAAKRLGVTVIRKGTKDQTVTYWSAPKGGYTP